MEKLSSIFFYHLDRAIKTYRQYAQIKLKEHGFSITVDQWMVLKAIDANKEINHNEIAENVFKDKASVTRIIDMLVMENYLKRELHPDSLRRNQLTITTKGKKLLKEIQPLILKNRRHALKDISPVDLLTTENVLKSIALNCRKK
jgi:DNA-binding MarR family transcriptional regulator